MMLAKRALRQCRRFGRHLSAPRPRQTGTVVGLAARVVARIAGW
ncbi:hypothetical protein F8B43_2071 [Methylorubrum populi]|uniref:Uncharacterized protein n=1 Tax=Methylorubrum populi TaxID=223967 RepID=A0A833J6M3_9HYPH|nr:hypothetical protein F8B43_2071 [Methylorubrum populi]